MLFAFVPIDGYGHVNSLLGLADALKSRGHNTAFICNDNESPRSRHHTIILREANETQKQQQQQHDTEEDVSQLDKKWMGAVDALDLESEPAKQLAKNFAVLDRTIKMEIFNMDEKLRELLAKLRPDVVVVDQLCTVPCIMGRDSPYKWVRSQSCNPLSLYSEKYPNFFPAPLLGVPVTGTREQLELSWSDFQRAISCCAETMVTLSQQAKLDEVKLINESPYLNIYMYPAYLDYSDHLASASGGALDSVPNWHRCDSLIRAPNTSSSGWQLPKEVHAGKKGKLIYVSLGTTTSCNVPLMRRLVTALGKFEHRFIVALGARHKQLLPLPENIWGKKYVDQPSILPLVDLLITHGGNNTVTEALYYGVPGMIVCPMFHDQLDNAARIEEKGLGVRLNLFKCTDEQLLDSINRLLNSNDCKQRCKLASEHMKKSGRGAEWAASLLEEVAIGKKLMVGCGDGGGA